MQRGPWSYYATPPELAFKAWALDFAPDNYGGYSFPREVDPNAAALQWQTEDWDPALRFWALPFDPNLNVWMQDQDVSLPSIMAAREFAAQHANWALTQAQVTARRWIDAADLAWQAGAANPLVAIQGEITAMFDQMEDDRDRFLSEIHAQADGLPAYFISYLGLDSERKPWTIELIRCGLAIGNIAYMYYKALYRRVRPSAICPGLIPPFGPPRHPSFPSGHSFLGHFIALLLLEIPEVARIYGERANAGAPGTLPTVDEVMSSPAHTFNGPLLWLGERLGRNRERVGLHYPSDSRASRWLAGAIWAILTHRLSGNPQPAAGGIVVAGNHIDCPTFRVILRNAAGEWAGR